MNIQTSGNRPHTKRTQSQEGPGQGQDKKNQDGNHDLPGDKDPVDGFSNGLNTTFNILKNTGIFVFSEMSEAAQNDPALGMRLFATTVSDKLLEGVDDGVRGGFEKAIVPTIRAGLLGLNTYRAVRTFKNPTSNLAQKGLDALRVATDLVGLAGGVLKVVSPSHAVLGETMMGYAYAADTVSHAIRGIEHGGDRIKVWRANQANQNGQGPDPKKS